MASPGLDQAFWPPLPGIFDLTLKFEETVFGLAPSSIITALYPFLIAHYSDEPVYVRRTWHLWTKVIASVALVAVEMASLSCRAASVDFHTETTLPAASVDLIAAMALGLLLYREHLHAMRASATLSVYLLLSLVIDAIKCRSFLSRPGLAPVGALAAAACGIRLILLVMEELPKKKLLLRIDVSNTVGGEATSGFWCRSFLLHLNPLLLTGYQSILAMSQLSSIGPDMISRVLHVRIKRYWNQRKPGFRGRLAMICFQAWKRDALMIFIPRLASTAFKFAQPFIIWQVIKFVESGTNDVRQSSALFGATVASFVGSIVTKTMTAHLCYRLITRVRGGLVAQIFDKVLLLPQAEAKKSAAMTLMDADIDGIAAGVPRLYELAMTVLEVALGTYLLSQFVGLSCLLVLIPIILSTVATYFLGGSIAAAFAMWNKSLQSRVAKTSRILGQLTGLKMMGLGPVIEKYLQELRVFEVDASKKHRYLNTVASIPVVGADLLTPVVVIAGALFWQTFDGGFSAATVFPGLSIIALIKQPLAILLNGYPLITSMLSCFRRIEAFLRLEERRDPRTIITPPTIEEINDGAAIPPLVEFVDAKIAPLGMHEPILSDLNFVLRPGSTTAVVGSNGSGKSSLLQSILGETALLGGLIRLGKTLIGFCDQTVWLRNGSIKDNIIGSLRYDQCWFERVIKAVALDKDLRQLPGGVEYIVGSGGVKLSGGQRQRVSIARSLYAQATLLVLDDVFSSLDRRTTLQILHHLLGEHGILQELNSTVIIATNLPEFAELADQVIRVDGNGQATVETVSRSTATREEILQNFISNHAGIMHDEDSGSEESTALHPGVEVTSTAAAHPQAVRREGNSGLHRLYVDPIGRLRLGVWSLTMLLASVGEIGPEIYMRLWIDRHPHETTYFVGYAAIAAITCFIFAITCYILFGDLTPRTALQLHQHLVATVVRASIGFLTGTDNGDVLNRFGQDMTLLVRNLPHAFMRTFYMFFLVVVHSGVIVAGASYMAAALPVILIPVYLIQGFYIRTSCQIRQLDIQAKSPLYRHFDEIAQGLLHVRAFGWTDACLSESLAALDESQKAFYYMYCIQLWLGLVLGLLSAILSGVLVVFALFLNNTSSGTAVGLAFLNLMVFADAIEAFIKAFTIMETSIGALSRLREFMDTTPQERNQTPMELPQNWPTGKIELKNVSAAYGGNLEDEAILHDVSVTVHAGEKVGFIGRTGSGKSSLFMALLGFLEYSGSMKIDELDVSEIPADQLRSRVVTISQDQIKLDASVRVNLLPFMLNEKFAAKDERQDRDSELQELLTRLGIWSLLDSHQGLDAKLDDVGYSHGEMQLLCLARGVLRHRDTGSKLILIDEATSTVEQEREQAARDLMTEYFSDCTVLVIGHRKSSMRGIRRIVEMAEGKIVTDELDLDTSSL